MSTYEKIGANGVIKQIEVPLYGSDHVGMAKRSGIPVNAVVVTDRKHLPIERVPRSFGSYNRPFS